MAREFASLKAAAATRLLDRVAAGLKRKLGP
jgi:hypothetical protein